MKIRKVLSMLLAVIMIVGMLPGISSAASAADTGKAIQLGVGGIDDPSSTQNSSGTYYTPKDYIYFGVKDSKPIKWRVLDADKANDGTTGGMFLLSEYMFYDDVKFEGATFSDDGDGQTNPNEWQYSDAQKWCSTFATNSFTATEKAALLGIAKTDSAESALYSQSWGSSSLTANDKVFFLSVREIADYLGNYSGAYGLVVEGDPSQSAFKQMWWLRTPSNGVINWAGLVGIGGDVEEVQLAHLGDGHGGQEVAEFVLADLTLSPNPGGSL